MRRTDCVRVVAHLASPLAGDAPYLDGVLEGVMARLTGRAARISRSDAPPPPGSAHTAIAAGEIGGFRVPRCSAPILAPEPAAALEHIGKKLDARHAGLLREREQKVVAVGGGTYKSYHLPLQVRPVPWIAWFALCHARDLRQKVRKHVYALGKKTALGYGQVARWEVEPVAEDWSWFAPHGDGGVVLMRNLPDCDALPADLRGAYRTTGAVCAPYWHPRRAIAIVAPC